MRLEGEGNGGRGGGSGGEGEGSGVKGGGKWGLGTPLSTPSTLYFGISRKFPFRLFHFTFIPI